MTWEATVLVVFVAVLLCAGAIWTARFLGHLSRALFAHLEAKDARLLEHLERVRLVGGTPVKFAERDLELKEKAWALEAEARQLDLEVKRAETAERLRRIEATRMRPRGPQDVMGS